MLRLTDPTAVGDSIEVLSGLSEGEAVATDPVAAGIWLKEQVK